jgi:DNA polymerase III gamma/tau subunit
MAKATLTERKVNQILNSGSMPNFAQLDHNNANFQSDYGRALAWIHQSVEDEDLRGELETYLNTTHRGDDIALIKHLNGVDIKLLGTISYCINRGAELAPKSLLRITNTLDGARNKAETLVMAADFEELADTASSRNIEAYKNCYSRMDNLRALVCKGKVELNAVHDEVMKILEAHGGLKKTVRKQLVDHYTQSVQEALEDKTIRDWVKPLKAILKAVGGEVKVAPKVTKSAAKPAKAEKVVQEPKKAAKSTKKAVKGKASKKAAKSTKKAVKGKAPKAAAKGKAANGMPKVKVKVQRDASQQSTASRVRDLIKAHKKGTDSTGMVAIVVRELGLTLQRGKSVVKAFWDKVEA